MTIAVTVVDCPESKASWERVGTPIVRAVLMVKAAVEDETVTGVAELSVSVAQ